MLFNLITAFEQNRGIGINNTIPFKITNDLKRFKLLTTNNIVIMGRNTWESLPIKPLSNRINVIISSLPIPNDNLYSFSSLTNALQFFKDYTQKIFIIGGEQLYKEAITYTEQIDTIYTTEVYNKYDCDTFFPKLDHFKIKTCSKFYYDTKSNTHFRYIDYISDTNNEHWINKEETTYLNTLRNILENGIQTNDRTGVGTYSLFGEHFTYNLKDTFPLLTTKRQFTRAIFEELMFYLRGQTDNNILTEKGIHIWDGNTSREFLDSRNLNHYPEGDMGETYGFNFRHYGGTYIDCKEKDKNVKRGFDQLENVIDLIKSNPNSRRIIINLWNPATNFRAALPSCLCWYQFYVNTDKKELNLQIYIRSSDYFLANNWNVCTGAFFVHLLCNLDGIDLTPGQLKVCCGDIHVYQTHRKASYELLRRKPKPFPKLVIKNQKKFITDFEWKDIEILGYKPLPGIKVEMAV